MKFIGNLKKVIVVAVFIAVIVLLVIFAGPFALKAAVYLFSLLSPFIFGYFVAYLINPVADRLQKRLKFPRGLSAALLVILTFAVMVGIIGGIGYKLFEEVKNLYLQSPQIADNLYNAWVDFSSKWSNLYFDMPESVQVAIDNMMTDLKEQTSSIVTNIQFVNAAQGFAKALPNGIIWTVIFLLSIFFMVSQREETHRIISAVLGERISAKVSLIKQEFRVYLGGYVKAQIILMFIVFVITAIVLAVLGAPYSLVVAAATAILDALPFFGSGLTLMPLAVVYFISGNMKLGIGYVSVYLATMLMRRFLEPKLVSDKMGFNPVLTLISMYAGYKWWGVGGLIIGPIILMVIISLGKVGFFDTPLRILRELLGFIKREFSMLFNYINNILTGKD